MNDRWCKSMTLPNGKKISGAAAREKRISAAGGMEEILTDVVNRATTLATQNIVEASNDSSGSQETKGKKKIK